MSTAHESPQINVGARRQGAALVVSLSRPTHANAYTQDMLRALDAWIDHAETDAGIRVVIITGAGEWFCAGADRDEIASRDWQSVLSLESARVFQRLQRTGCVTIAAINGAAVGGGLELALACDLRLASTHARFWLPEPDFGLMPAAGGTRWLPRLVGPLKAKELILGGAEWDAAHALAAGLLTEVVAPADLIDRALAWTDRIARRDPSAIRLAKDAIEMSLRQGDDRAFDLAAQSLLVIEQRRRAGAKD
jgi:methylglutaconyl-CoA hydratase